MCGGKVRETRRRVGGSRGLNYLMEYVHRLEQEQEQQEWRLTLGDATVDDAANDLLESYCYNPTQIIDGGSVFGGRDLPLTYWQTQPDTLCCTPID
jgi:dynamin-like GTPase MGM1, mitochondrial